MKCKTPFTNKQLKAVEGEVRRAIVKQDIKYAKGYDAAVLWVLHKEFGFGAQRLKKVFDKFFEHRAHIRERYLADDDDDAFICQRALLSVGVDMDELYKEKQVEKSDKLKF